MPPSTLGRLRHLAWFAACSALAACATSDAVMSPLHAGAPSADIAPPPPTLVVSQVYGGGGNNGATLTNDFIELYNPGSADVALSGYSVQYASATGTGSWLVTTLSGTIPAGHYFLVQEAQGSGGTTALPAPDVTGTIAMSAASGKVALVNTHTALSGACPTSASIVDLVGYGTANCSEGGHPAPGLTNTTADLRGNNGAEDTNDNAHDFASGTPNPRNSGIAAPTQGTPATIAVSPATWSLKIGQTKTFTATAKDANGTVVTTTIAWSSSNTAVATIDPSSGLATGVATGSVTITATSPNNVTGTATLTVTAGGISVQPRTDPLPVGFQDQLFLTAPGTDINGNPVGNNDVTWSSSDPTIISVNSSTGVITARTAGTVTITATAKSDGVTKGSATTLADVEPVGASARTGHNTELGIPTDANPSDDIMIARRQYTMSYNANHGGPNWVSWNLDASHKGSASRCNCFTADTALTRLGFPAYDTNDWINGGAYSRGHMSPSADWADASGDNAPTFFLSNMIPQNQTANQDAWGDLENYLRTLAVGSAEIYIVSGPIFTKNRSGAGVDGLGFMNSLGHIAIPDSMWKIAVVVPDARSATQIASPSDVQVIAANMPNDATATGTWNRYATTIDNIQRSTGYDFLSALPEAIQCKLEVRNCLPVPVIVPVSGSATATVGTQFVVNTSATDADGADGPWRFLIEWGDGTTFAGGLAALPTAAHPFARGKTYTTPGTYTVRLTITDKNGGRGIQTLVVTVN